MVKKLLNQWTTAWSNSGLKANLAAPLTIGITSLLVSGAVLGLRYLGQLQQLELLAYDQMVRLQPDKGPDSRLLVVAITEADIRSQRRWPLSDQTLSQAIANLQRHQPVAIGLDIYRDIPQEPGHQQLVKQFKASNIIGITKISDANDVGVAPPPALPEAQVGFNDISSDPDGVIRRNLMFADSELSDGSIVTLYSFSLQLALAYLQQKGIQPKASAINEEYMQVGDGVFIPLTETSGGYQRADAQGYQILLDYRSKENVARQVTLSQVLKGDLKPEWVKGKIVLIGATARSAKDTFLTPYSPMDPETPLMSGVEIHAQSVSQILGAALDGEQLFWFWDERTEVLWIVGWSVLGGLLAWFIRHPIVLGISGSLTMTTLLGCCFSLFLQKGWVPVAAPALCLVTTGGIVVTYRAHQAQRQQQIVMTLLGQNTSPEIAIALWKSRDRLVRSGRIPGQRLTATMMFTDIRGFSSISEQMPPESLLELLNEYLGVITSEVKVHQGIINKFTGDGMLAVFGVPVARTSTDEIAQDARHAVACALAMGDRLQELNQRWEQRGLPAIEMRVGIFTGNIVVGSLGGKDRMEYGVIGDCVNIASRLESYAKERQTTPCRILIARETLIYIEEDYEVEVWGPAALKGKQQLVEVYRVVGRKSPSPSPVNHSSELKGI